MPRQVDPAGVVEEVVRLADRTPDRTVWIGIDGFGGAGKSTLAARLAEASSRVTVVHVDDFSKPALVQWDWDRFEEQVAAPLRAGRVARYQVWDWDRDVGDAWHEITPGRVVVVEGVSSTRREVEIDWDLTVWVETPRNVRLGRARERDGAAMISHWLDVWMPSEEAYARRDDPAGRLDLVVAGC